MFISAQRRIRAVSQNRAEIRRVRWKFHLWDRFRTQVSLVTLSGVPTLVVATESKGLSKESNKQQAADEVELIAFAAFFRKDPSTHFARSGRLKESWTEISTHDDPPAAQARFQSALEHG